MDGSGAVSQFIIEHRTQITSVWRARIGEIPEVAALAPAALVDHMPEFLLELAHWVAGDRDAATRAYVHLVQGHALQRLGHGVDLGTLLLEYQALREVLLTEVLAHVTTDPKGIVELNRALDVATSESVRRFALQREEIRERFVGILGHDLRNPLMALTLAAETILATPSCGQPSHARLASSIQKGGERMSRMIGDLVDFALGQLGGGIPVVPQTCDMAEICREAIDELRATHPDRDIRLVATGNLVGSWDRDRVVQVISNLVANAIVHGTDPIEVRACETEDRQYVLTDVRDAGAPIPREVIEGLFDPFRRGTKARRGGLGLGLYIVQQIALAHGARCTVESTAGRGTTFRVRWPRTPLDEVPRPFQQRA